MSGQLARSPLMLRYLAQTVMRPAVSSLYSAACLKQDNDVKPNPSHNTGSVIDIGFGSLITPKVNFQEKNLDSLSLYMSTKTNLEDVLRFIDNRTVSAEEAVTILRRLYQLADADKWNVERVDRDGTLRQLTDILMDNVTSLNPTLLIQQVQYVHKLYPQDHKLLESSENQVLNLVKKMPVSQLFKLIQLYNVQRRTKVGEQVYAEAWKLMQSRWVEVDNPKTLVSIMYLAEKSCPEFMVKLEERALDLVPQMSLKDLYRIFYQISKGKNRNTPLLRALAHHLNKVPLSLSLIQLSNLAYACAVMNFYDDKLLGKICHIVHNSKSELDANKPVCTSLLKSISTLRYCHPDLLSTIASVMLVDMKNVADPDLVCLLLTCANLDNVPSLVATHLREIMDRLGPLKDSDPPLWLDTVWSLVVLNRAAKDVVSSVLRQEFIDKLHIYETPVKVAWQLKLLNICLAVQHEIPDYDRQLPNNLQLCKNIDEATLAPVGGETSFHSQVFKALEALAPAEKYQKRNVHISPSLVIDALIHLDPNGRPKAVNDPISTGDTKLAVRILDFKDMTLGIDRATGPQAFNTRILGHLGYKVIEVHYTEMKALKTFVDKVKYLENKIKKS